MTTCLITDTNEPIVTIEIVAEAEVNNWLATQDAITQQWLNSIHFDPSNDKPILIPDATGNLVKVIVTNKEKHGPWLVPGLATLLPQGVYRFKFVSKASDEQIRAATLGWGMSCYQFIRYKKAEKIFPSLLVDDKSVYQYCDILLQGIYLTRDLINTPTEDMGPSHLGTVAEKLAKQFSAAISIISGDDLLKQNYPSIHAVGRASAREPKLIDMRWGNSSDPKVTLVGKGVCFDTGGLDLKPSAGMRLMKKDMGGAAHVLGLASAIMQAKLPLRLRVLISAVENSVSANSYRPGDVITTRKGITIEVGNTDAEGRVVLSDALWEASQEKPELIMDFATLTGAARIALGPDIMALFSNDDGVANDLQQLANQYGEPMWRLPLHQPYQEYIKTPIADISNNASIPLGGAITAGLFLQEFIGENIKWCHFDIMAWNQSAKPNRPEGADAMGFRTLFKYLSNFR